MFGAPEVNHVNIILGLVQQFPQWTTHSLIGHLSGEWRYLVLNVLVDDGGGGDFRDVGGYEDGRSVGGVDDWDVVW